MKIPSFLSHSFSSSQPIESQTPSHLTAVLKRISRMVSITVAGIGIVVLWGWGLQIPLLKSILPGLVTMKPNTALGFLLGGLSLLGLHQANLKNYRLQPQQFRRLQGFAKVSALIITGIGGLTLIQYAFQLDLKIDQLLFPEDADAIATYYPGRMAVNTAIIFFLQGIALFLLSYRSYIVSQILSVFAFLLSFLGLLGYCYGITEFYGLGSYTQMAIHTVIGFLLLSLGALFFYPDRGLMKTATSELAGGVMLRRLFLAVLIIPSLLGWFILAGIRANLYNNEVGIALLCILNITILASLIWWSANTLGEVDYQALHDPLTGLPNRILFNKRLENSLAEARHLHGILAVIFLDLDRFKKINDSLGHNLGDDLIKAVADRISDRLHQDDVIARWGGDEFTILIPKINGIEQAENIAKIILNTLKTPFFINQNALHITASLGIALYPGDGNDSATLIKNADVALYSAKEKGRNNYQFYSPEINSEFSELLAIENRLHHALDRQEFFIHYQPKVNIETKKITGVEALIRWQSPMLGIISPAKFIPIAEENGLITSIGEWVLRTACQQVQDWIQAGLPPVKVAVNLSVRQFQEENLVQNVTQILAETGLDPNYLELEITETIAMQNRELTKAILYQFDEMGVSISMDDFGTGYSSLNYLKNFPLHTLKIDRSFVRDLTTDPCDVAIATTIIALGHGLKMSVVAEGVETFAQLECLRSLGCEEIQGYLFSRPLPPERIADLLRKYQDQPAEIQA